MVETQFNIYNKYKVTGDKGLMFRTEVIKNYKFQYLMEKNSQQKR